MESAITQLANLRGAVTECRKKTEDTHSTVKDLSRKIDDLENRSRRCNLIFYGVPDSESRELPAVSEKKVQEIVSRLGLTPVQIERAHRLGRSQANKPRPLIAMFSMFKDKQAILANARKLKGSNISISEDFSEAVRRKRKFLWEFGKRNALDGARVNLKYDKLFLNGQAYVYDEA